MKFVGIFCGLMLLGTMAAQGQDGVGALLDTNFYVAGVSDWKGNLTVQVLSAPDYDQLKKDVAWDNRALNYAYQNLKFDWKARHSKATTTEPNPKVPPFPLKRPSPKVFHFFAKVPTAEAAEQKKSSLEERETARRQRLETANERALAQMSDKKRDAIEDKAATETDLMEQLQAEITDVKMSMEMGLDPGRKQEPTTTGASKSGHKTVTTKQGPRLGEDSGDLIRGGNLVDQGELKKKR